MKSSPVKVTLSLSSDVRDLLEHYQSRGYKNMSELAAAAIRRFCSEEGQPVLDRAAVEQIAIEAMRRHFSIEMAMAKQDILQDCLKFLNDQPYGEDPPPDVSFEYPIIQNADEDRSAEEGWRAK